MPSASFILFSSEESGTYMSQSTKFVHEMVLDIANLSINILELLSIVIIVVTTVVAFYRLINRKPYARVYLLHGQSMGLTFKLGAEILRTIPARTLDEIWQILLLIVIKIMMGLLIEWELHGVESPTSVDGFDHEDGEPHIFHFPSFLKRSVHEGEYDKQAASAGDSCTPHKVGPFVPDEDIQKTLQHAQAKKTNES